MYGQSFLTSFQFNQIASWYWPVKNYFLALHTKRMIYWSRSRNGYWEKGVTSGHIQSLVRMAFDCDGDVILCLVKQIGTACHTGRPNYFYLEIEMQQQQVSVIGEACPL